MNEGHQEDVPASDDRLRPAEEILAARVRETVVLIHLQTDRICELNRTGSRFWELLCEGYGRFELQQRLAQEFDVDPGELAGEIDRLVHALRSEGLIAQ
jgi:hypothetical protein